MTSHGLRPESSSASSDSAAVATTVNVADTAPDRAPVATNSCGPSWSAASTLHVNRASPPSSAGTVPSARAPGCTTAVTGSPASNPVTVAVWSWPNATAVYVNVAFSSLTGVADALGPPAGGGVLPPLPPGVSGFVGATTTVVVVVSATVVVVGVPVPPTP